MMSSIFLSKCYCKFQSNRKGDFQIYNKLIINRIWIKDFGDLDSYETTFNPGIAILSSPFAKSIMNALLIAIKGRAFTDKRLNTDNFTTVKVEAEIGGETYIITLTRSHESETLDYSVTNAGGNLYRDFYERIHLNPEEEDLTCFTYDRKNRYSNRFQRYKDIEKYHSKELFNSLTDGIGSAKLFRICLNEHLKKRSPRCSALNDILSLDMNDTGQFIFNSSSLELEPSTTKDFLFEYLCFLNINLFWQNLETIRDFNHINWPLFIYGWPELNARPSYYSEYIKKAMLLNRQVFICSG